MLCFRNLHSKNIRIQSCSSYSVVALYLLKVKKNLDSSTSPSIYSSLNNRQLTSALTNTVGMKIPEAWSSYLGDRCDQMRSNLGYTALGLPGPQNKTLSQNKNWSLVPAFTTNILNQGQVYIVRPCLKGTEQCPQHKQMYSSCIHFKRGFMCFWFKGLKKSLSV